MGEASRDLGNRSLLPTPGKVSETLNCKSACNRRKECMAGAKDETDKVNEYRGRSYGTVYWFCTLIVILAIAIRWVEFAVNGKHGTDADCCDDCWLWCWKSVTIILLDNNHETNRK